LIISFGDDVTAEQRVKEIVRGKRGVTPETAWLFFHAPGTPPSSE
jgi:plasmid maintenance system antidote protein VapI